MLTKFPELGTKFKSQKTEQNSEITCSYYHANCTKVNNAPKLSNDQQKIIFNIIEENMKAYYQKSKRLPWDAEKKKEEIFETKMRFIVCFDNDKIVGFTAFMFDIEDKRPVLYLYELQIIKEYQHYGIGHFLMSLMNQIAKNVGMSHVMLTVFTHNEIAMNFYLKKCSYVIDSFSPSKSGKTGFDYEILSKKILVN